MQTLERVSQVAGRRGHPGVVCPPTRRRPTARRRLTEQIETLGAGKQRFEPVNRDAYLRLLDGMVYGKDPREGYSRGSTFFHPAMRFRFVFPAGGRSSTRRRRSSG